MGDKIIFKFALPSYDDSDIDDVYIKQDVNGHHYADCWLGIVNVEELEKYIEDFEYCISRINEAIQLLKDNPHGESNE